MPRKPGRKELARYAAPVAFLGAVTVAVLLVRTGLHGRGAAGGVTSTARVETKARPATRTAAATGASTARRPSRPARRFYTIQRGDTFEVIAARFRTSVAAIEALNPNVSSNALSIGQRIRVK